MIYHANHGPPLLEAGSHFKGPIKRVTPFNAHAAKSVTSYAEYSRPVKGFIEQVYCLEPYADEQGKTMILLQNAPGNRAVSMQFDVSELPYVTLWKNCNAVEEGYESFAQFTAASGSQIPKNSGGPDLLKRALKKLAPVQNPRCGARGGFFDLFDRSTSPSLGEASAILATWTG